MPTVVLVAAHLGIDGILPAYQQQLRELFRWPQTLGEQNGEIVGPARHFRRQTGSLPWCLGAGVIGGKPGSSLYLVGCQGEHVLFLDPHEVQAAPEARQEPLPLESYHKVSVRSMPCSALDPSMALGFLCTSAAEFDDLCRRISEMAAAAGSTPLLSVSDHEPPRAPDLRGAGRGGDEDWEVL